METMTTRSPAPRTETRPSASTQSPTTVQKLEKWFNKHIDPVVAPIIERIDRTRLGRATTDTLARFGAAELTFLFHPHVANDTIGAFFAGGATFALSGNPVLAAAVGIAAGKKMGTMMRSLTEPNAPDLRESGIAKVIKAFKTGKLEEPTAPHPIDRRYEMYQRIEAVLSALFTDRRVSRATWAVLFPALLGGLVGGPAFAPIMAGVGAVVYDQGSPNPLQNNRLGDVADVLAEIWRDPSKRKRGLFQRAGTTPVPIAVPA